MRTETSKAPTALQLARDLLIPGAPFEQIERAAAALKRADLATGGLRPLKVQVLANITTDYLVDHLRLMLVRAGFAPAIGAGQYGALVRGLLGEVDLTAPACDAAIVVLTHRDIQFPPVPGMSAQEARDLVKREVEFWSTLLSRVRIPMAVLSFDLPPVRPLDEQDGLAPGGLGWHIKQCNLELASLLPSSIAMVDAEAMQYRVGAAHWHDARLYHLCKQPFTMETLPEVAHSLVAALAGLLGRSRKVLVLDLDNTLWGGVIGDDGLQGIELGAETAEGEAFRAFQLYAKQLAARGIILAVCSKNQDEVARSAFREHSGMVLKEEDISCFVANFEDKASNLRHIASTLNLGLDSFVFVDDNPVERALIRSTLPEVLVVELPEDPALYTQALEASKAFPLRALTAEDLARGASYRAMAAVQAAKSTPGTDMEQFLIGLEPKACVEPVDASSLDRIVQLIKKTNQFKLNLSTYEPAEISARAEHVLALRLSDRLQDHGIVAIVVSEPDNGTLRIRNWVMSCRVFGRRLENLTLELLCAHAAAHGCREIAAAYTATAKNVILPPILARLGFTADADNVYHRSAADPVAEPHHMSVTRRAAAS